MANIIMSKLAGKLDPSVKKKAYVFLEKLSEDDAAPGLHIEPITNSADDKVRTGRVDQFYRAVLFKVPSTGEATYVFHGIWPHDEAPAIPSSWKCFWVAARTSTRPIMKARHPWP